MAKIQKNAQNVTKILLSASIFQLMLISLILVPATDCFSMEAAILRAYIPEMTEYAILTASLSIPIGAMSEKLFKK